jgi:hypothetical protein
MPTRLYYFFQSHGVPPSCTDILAINVSGMGKVHQHPGSFSFLAGLLIPFPNVTQFSAFSNISLRVVYNMIIYQSGCGPKTKTF